jgi:uncharacterized phage protein (TIGR01671 family)
VNRCIKFRIWVPADDTNPGYMELPPEPGVTPVDPAVLDLNGRLLALQGEDLANNTAEPAAEFPPDSVLMQWTGIRDKNGVDIYEGDIFAIRNVMTGEEGFTQVRYNCQRAAFTVLGFRGGKRLEASLGEWFEEFAGTSDVVIGAYEVAGNVFEHPDLLRGVS